MQGEGHENINQMLLFNKKEQFLSSGLYTLRMSHYFDMLISPLPVDSACTLIAEILSISSNHPRSYKVTIIGYKYHSYSTSGRDAVCKLERKDCTVQEQLCREVIADHMRPDDSASVITFDTYTNSISQF